MCKNIYVPGINIDTLVYGPEDVPCTVAMLKECIFPGDSPVTVIDCCNFPTLPIIRCSLFAVLIIEILQLSKSSKLLGRYQESNSDVDASFEANRPGTIGKSVNNYLYKVKYIEFDEPIGNLCARI